MLQHWRCLPSTCITAAGLLAGLCLPLSGQTSTTGTLSGRVTDRSGAAVADVLVTAMHAATRVSVASESSAAGAFRFDFLAPGLYELTLEKIGYRPMRLTDIVIAPGAPAQVERVLTPAEAATATVSVETAAVAVPGGQNISAAALRSFDGLLRDTDDLVRLSSIADDEGSTEGLPPSLSAIVVDGVTFRPSAHPLVRNDPLSGSVFPTSAFGFAQLVTNPVDVEWGGSAGGFLNVLTTRGTRSIAGDADAAWSGDALSVPSGVEFGSLMFNDLQGGFALRGPLADGSGHFSTGLEVRRQETPFSASWTDSEAVEALAAHAQASGVDIESYRQPDLARSDVLTGFARVDWSLAAQHRLDAGAHFTSLARLRPTGIVAAGTRALDGHDVVADVVLRSWSDRTGNELRVAFTGSERSSADDAATPPTLLVQEGLEFDNASTAARALSRGAVITDVLQLNRGAHTAKFGGALALRWFEHGTGEHAGNYAFGDVDLLMSGTGVLVRREAEPAVTEWSTREFAGFVQDRWRLTPRLELLAGVRVEHDGLPSGVSRDDEWFRLTGLANDDVAATALRISPRAGISWAVDGAGRTVLQANGGIYYDMFDPLLLAEWQRDAGDVLVRRVVGAVTWPPSTAVGGSTNTRLTMLGPDFTPPKTVKVGGAVTRHIGGATSIQLGVVARRTENLPRRTDLNLIATPATHDQYGRGVFGTLVKQGGLLVAQPGSGRRFTTYDEVAAITADGWSEYWGLTAAVEREASRGIDIIARYTYGRAEDNWFAAERGGWTVPRPTALEGAASWDESIADFDVPHRGVLALRFDVPAGIRVGAIYRIQSGRTFTPGFRNGVDANADGHTGNDPAFVDPDLPGMSEVMARSPCLRSSASRFAGRNSCRTDAVHGLDMTLRWDVLRFAGATTALTIDAVDLLESWQPVPDAALYVVDPATDLVTNAADRTVTVPLIVNPDFGEPLVHRRSGRIIRLGLSLNW